VSTLTPPTPESDALAPPRAMIRPLVIMVLCVTLVLGAIFGWQAFVGGIIKKAMAAGASMPQTVSTADAAKSAWQAKISAIGSLRAVRGADLSAMISGVVDDIEFDSGNDVPAGKVLLKLRPYDDYAKLEQLKAAAELADQTLKRDREQFAAQAVSQATIDTDEATLKSARAQVVAQQALIDEKIIKAPFAGQLGIRQVDVGQYLAAGTTVVTLQSLDPIYIDFYVPQESIAHLKLGQAATAQVDAYPGESFKGAIEAINSKVDAASRNVQVRASFRNADRRLVPGMFANVAVEVGESTEQITLPQTAITYNPYGDTVYVVKHTGAAGAQGKDTVEQHFVVLGATRGDQIAIESGVNVGDVVVTSGQMKLRNGAAVTVNNKLQPTDERNPSPPNE
jgi:membrane fusion protein, multidrug efflux system